MKNLIRFLCGWSYYFVAWKERGHNFWNSDWFCCYLKFVLHEVRLQKLHSCFEKQKPTINFAFSGKSICNDKYFSILIFYSCISVSWTFDCVLIRSIKIMLQWLRNKLRNILSVICIDTFTISFLTSGHSEDKVWSSFYTQPLDMANPPSLYPFPNHLLLTTLFLQ